MFYTTVDRIGNYIYCQGYKDGKKFKGKEWYKPTLYLPSQKPSKYKDIYNNYVEPLQFSSMKDCTDFIKKYSEVEGFTYNGMENAVYSFISDRFENDIKYDQNLIKIGFYDIEVKTDRGFPDIETANGMITAITIKCRGHFYVWGIKEYKNNRKDVTYKQFDREEDMLLDFVEFMERERFDLITAWSGEQFDIPYTINRITRVNGPEVAERLSPYKVIKKRTVMTLYGNYITYDILGLNFIDYKLLYQKFAEKPQESYTLNYISYVELGEKKLDYSEFETLDNLFEKDYQKYIDYNIRDTDLIEKIDNKIKLFNTMFRMAYNAKINYADVFKHTRLWDGIVYSYLKKQNIIIPRKPKYTSLTKTYAGGYVKEPTPAMYDWVVSLDALSLYPHVFMQVNIGADTYKSKLNVNFEDLVDGKPHGHEQYLRDNNLAMSASGAVFSKDKRSFLSQLLEDMFGDRKTYKNKMLATKKELENKRATLSEEEIKKYEDLAEEYRIIQESLKRQLVACYGAHGTPTFRYYKIDTAEAITTSGRHILRWTEKRINEYIEKITGIKKDYVIYGDTDSLWVNFADVVAKFCPEGTPRDKIVEFLDKFIESKIQPFLTKIMKELSEYFNGYGERIYLKREKICNKAIFTGKKRYMANVIDSEGVRYSEPELSVTGLESKRSSVPEICRKAFGELYYTIMNEDRKAVQEYIAAFKEKFKNSPLEEIAIPKSMNALDDYRDVNSIYAKGTPMHARGSLLFNHYVDKYNIGDKYQKIVAGEKIKYIMLKLPNPINENVISFISVLPKELNLNDYIDYDTQFEKTFLKPSRELLKIIGWEVEEKTNLEDLFV